MTTFYIPPSLEDAIALPVVRPLHLVRIGTTTPRYYSSRESVEFEGATWQASTLKVVGLGSLSPSISWANEGTLRGRELWEYNAAGTRVDIYQAYSFPSYTTTGNPGRPTGYTPPVLRFSGFLGDLSIGSAVAVRGSQDGGRRTPTVRVTDQDFKHLPKPGDRISTTQQDIILR